MRGIRAEAFRAHYSVLGPRYRLQAIKYGSTASDQVQWASRDHRPGVRPIATAIALAELLINRYGRLHARHRSAAERRPARFRRLTRHPTTSCRLREVRRL